MRGGFYVSAMAGQHSLSQGALRYV